MKLHILLCYMCHNILPQYCSLIEALQFIIGNNLSVIYHNCIIIFKVLILPITIAERSFSKSKIIKNYLRSVKKDLLRYIYYQLAMTMPKIFVVSNWLTAEKFLPVKKT